MNFGGFCDLKMRVTFILIVLSFVQKALLYYCPRDLLNWKLKEIAFQCPGKKEYHCMLDETLNATKEKCIEKSWMDAGFCPKYVSNADTVDVFPCDEINGICPHQLYWTNEVFLYNACLPTNPNIIVPATEKRASTKVYLIGEPPQSTANTTADSERNENASKGGVPAVIFVTTILGCIIIVGIFIILIFYKQKRRMRNDRTERSEEIGPITPFIEPITPFIEPITTFIEPITTFISTGEKDIATPLADQTSDGKKVSRDGKFDYSERLESVGNIVEKAGPILRENGILVLVSSSKRIMKEVAQAVALTCDTQEYPEGFKEFNDSFAEMDGSSITTKCVVFNDCFNIRLHGNKNIFKDLYEKQVASRERLRFVISVPMTLWNARRLTLSSWELFNDKYILKFKDLEIRNSIRQIESL